MKDLKLSSMGIWISVGDDYVIKLSSSGAAPYAAEWHEHDRRAELARRIVACVNACCEVDTETLEQSVSRDRVIAIFRTELSAIARRAAQRDELLAALESMVSMMDSGDEHGAGSEWHQQAKAAIARAKGGAA